MFRSPRVCASYVNLAKNGLLQTNCPKLSQFSRTKVSTPLNTIVMFVPQQEAWVVERMGRFHRILEPGLNVLLPIMDRIKYVQSLKEIAIDVPKQSAITSDNVTLSIDGVLYLRIIDAYRASYGVEDPEFAITQLAQTTMRSELGKLSLDKVFRERETLNVSIVESINKASEAWGITCLRYEIRDIRLPSRVHEAMQMQVEAERRKRAAILESEGVREADINVAEGKRKSRILASEAERQEQINQASGEAAAILAIADARARGLQTIAKAIGHEDGRNAASLSIAEQYISAFNDLAKTNNTMILPSNVGDIPNVVAQALTIYKAVSGSSNPVTTSTFAEQSTTNTTIVNDNLLKDIPKFTTTASNHAKDILNNVAHEFDNNDIVDIELDTLHSSKGTQNGGGKSDRKKK